jgi:hypothetical protein
MAEAAEKITIQRDSQPAHQVTIQLGRDATPPALQVNTSLKEPPSGVKDRLVVDVNGLTEELTDAFFEGIELMSQAFSAQLKRMPEDNIAGLVSVLIPAKPARPTLLREAKMLAKGKTRILQSGDWLTAQEVAEVAGFKTVNSSAQPSKWKRSDKIFTLRHEGVDYFPVYGLDPSTGYRPLKALAPIIEVLKPVKDGWGLAFWFGSANSYLSGRLPKEVLKEDAASVLEAAKNEVCGVLHG